MRMFSKTCLAAAAFCMAGSALAAEPTRDEAVAIVGKVVSYIKQHGVEKGLAEINNHTTAQFRDGSLYVFAFDQTGKQVGHGNNPKMINRDLIDAKDANGVPFVRNILALTKKGKGWTDYHWPNPATGAVEAKQAYCEKTEKDVLICSGIYKK